MNRSQDTLLKEASRSPAAAGTSGRTKQPGPPDRRSEEASSHSLEIPWWKRPLDLVCCFFLLTMALPLMLFIVAGLKWVSPGPVFFKQERVGYRRKRFICLKFRTMTVGEHTAVHQQHLKQLLQSNGPMTKLDAMGDHRLIPFGAWLRASGLDELPQLINVLSGEMSLVGPRPCTPYELESYLPWQFARFDTLPGLTGLWQVSGKNKTTFTEMIHMDVHYAKNKSLQMDVKIMARTFSALARQVLEVRSKSLSQRGIGNLPENSPPENESVCA